MERASTIGLDIAKRVLQAHGGDGSGHVVFRKRLMRDKLLAFFAAQPPCTVALEACGGAHHWAREIGKLGGVAKGSVCVSTWNGYGGHAVRLVPPAYVEPYVKRQKNDAAAAEAICEAAMRPSMRFGERTIRRLLILGASAVIRWASQRGAPAGSWLAGMLARKPKMLVTVALSNKTARIIWALLVKAGVYRAPVVAVYPSTAARAWGEQKESYGPTVGETGLAKPGCDNVRPSTRL